MRRNSGPIRHKNSASPQRTFIPTYGARSSCCRSMTAAPRFMISPHMLFICRAVSGWKPTPVWATHGQSTSGSRQDAGVNATEYLQSQISGATVSWSSRHPPQPSQRQQNVRSRRHSCAHVYAGPERTDRTDVCPFRNYPEFLNAFQKGEVTRIAVVERLERPPGRLAAGQLPQPVKELMKATDPNRQYAAASDH